MMKINRGGHPNQPWQDFSGGTQLIAWDVGNGFLSEIDVEWKSFGMLIVGAQHLNLV